MLQLLHELFHLLLAVRAEAACATASASYGSRSGSSNTRRAGATAAASRSSWANRSRSCSRRAGASAASRSSWWLIGGCGLGAGVGLRAWGRDGAGTGAEGAGGRGLGAGGRGGACPCASVASGGGWGLGPGTGGQKFLRCTSHTCLYQKHVHVLQLLHDCSGCTGRSRLRHCQWKQLGQPNRIQQHPPGRCHVTGQTEVNPAAGEGAASRSSWGLIGGCGLGGAAAGGGGQGRRLGRAGAGGQGAGGWGLGGWGRGGGWGWGGGLGLGGGGLGGGPGGRGLGAGTRLRHTRDTREHFANASRTRSGRFANALATIPGQPLDPNL